MSCLYSVLFLMYTFTLNLRHIPFSSITDTLNYELLHTGYLHG